MIRAISLRLEEGENKKIVSAGIPQNKRVWGIWKVFQRLRLKTKKLI